MAVSYDKLWSLLIKKGMTKSELCDLSGLSTNVLAKLSKNESIQVDVLGKICTTLNCKLDDIIEFDGSTDKYVPIPNICLYDLKNSDDYEELGYEYLYDFPHPITRKTISSYLVEWIKSSMITYEAGLELVDKLESINIHISFPDTIVPDYKLLPIINDWNEESRDNKIKIHQIENYVNWRIKNKIIESNCSNVGKEIKSNSKLYVERGILSKRDGGEYIFHGTKETFVDFNLVYPLNVLLDVFKTDIYLLEQHYDKILDEVEKSIYTLKKDEIFVIQVIYRKGLIGKQLKEYFGFPNIDEIDIYLREHFDILNKALRKLRHPARWKEYRKYIKFESMIELRETQDDSMAHIVKDYKSLKEVMEENDVNDIQTLRELYLSGKRITDADVVLENLFQDNSIEYSLMNKTEKKDVQWFDLGFAQSDTSKRYRIFFGIDFSCSVTVKYVFTKDMFEGKYALFYVNNAIIKSIRYVSDSYFEELFNIIVKDYSKDTYVYNVNHPAVEAIRFDFEKNLSELEGQLTENIIIKLARELIENYKYTIRYNIPIEELYLSYRPYRILKRHEVNTVADLANKSIDDYLKMRNMTKSNIVEIHDKLYELGIEIAGYATYKAQLSDITE